MEPRARAFDVWARFGQPHAPQVVANLTSANEMPILEVVTSSVVLASLPAGVMLLGSLLTVMQSKPPPKAFAHALQHFAGGIMFCAIAVELVPPLVAAQGPKNMVGMIVGFCLGVMVMLGMSVFLEEGDEGSDEGGSDGGDAESNKNESMEHTEDEETGGDNGGDDGGRGGAMVPLLQPDPSPTPPVRRGRSKRGRTSMTSSFDGEDYEDRSGSFRGRSADRHSDRGLSMVGEAYRLATSQEGRRKSSGAGEDAALQPFPAVFAMAVYIDSMMDGLLVGLTLVTGKSAGLYMAVAMAFEMGFLGLTFAAACSYQPKIKALTAVVAGPLFLMLGSAIGGVVANALAVNEPALVGCTAFGVAALLYMVAEELLVSAHEEGEEHVWWIDLQVFNGFLMALIVAKWFG